MEIKQQLKLSQQLVMTPQLQQAIRLLQLSRLELIDEIRKELDANPVLADEEIDPRARANGDAKNGEAINEPPAPDSPAMASEKANVSDLEKRADEKRVQEIDWEQFLENRTLQQPLPSNRGGYEELPADRAEPHQERVARRSPALADAAQRLHRRGEEARRARAG